MTAPEKKNVRGIEGYQNSISEEENIQIFVKFSLCFPFFPPDLGKGAFWVT